VTISIFEVGPRDGLQSEEKVLSPDSRTQLIEKLVLAGLEDIEVGSFVRADKIPQLQDTSLVLAACQKIRQAQKLSPKNLRFWAFVPNQRGFEDALKAKVDGASFFIAASKTFCQKNVNRSQEDLLLEIEKLLPLARKNKIASRVYLSTISFCPYEGKIDSKVVISLVQKLFKFGAKELVLRDTTGSSNPFELEALLKNLTKKVPASRLALHLHDTRGLALTNIYSAMKFGIRRFDSSIGGMGGCPYAPGASGNLSTEDLANLLFHSKKFKKVDLSKLCEAGAFAQELLGKKLPSKFLQAFIASGKVQ
jgi:hydroxymethylglutaryl-CoA lyase